MNEVLYDFLSLVVFCLAIFVFNSSIITIFMLLLFDFWVYFYSDNFQ